jgi:hypothetical protein
MIITAERSQVIRELNCLPINRAAADLLKQTDWPPNDWTLHLLTLMQWGLWEKNINVDYRPLCPTPDAVEAMVLKLDRWNPMKAMTFMLNPVAWAEGVDNPDELEEVCLTEAEFLGITPEEGAMRALESVSDGMVATAP